MRETQNVKREAAHGTGIALRGLHLHETKHTDTSRRDLV